MSQNQNSSDKDKKPLRDSIKKPHRKDGSLAKLGEIYDLKKMLRDKGFKLKDDNEFRNTGI